jgi:hypothetical protein
MACRTYFEDSRVDAGFTNLIWIGDEQQAIILVFMAPGFRIKLQSWIATFSASLLADFYQANAVRLGTFDWFAEKIPATALNDAYTV